MLVHFFVWVGYNGNWRSKILEQNSNRGITVRSLNLPSFIHVNQIGHRYLLYVFLMHVYSTQLMNSSTGAFLGWNPLTQRLSARLFIYFLSVFFVFFLILYSWLCHFTTNLCPIPKWKNKLPLKIFICEMKWINLSSNCLILSFS